MQILPTFGRNVGSWQLNSSGWTSTDSMASNSLVYLELKQTNRRQLLVGGFKVEECLLYYLIVWLLCPRATNHAQCSEQDLLLLYGILNNILIDWPARISDTMLKAKKYDAYHLSYALLISRILDYKGVSVDDEKNQEAEDDDMDAHMTEPVGVVAPSEVEPSTMPSSSPLSPWKKTLQIYPNKWRT
ncbi:hypothetical protein LR48_Vigan04g135500 [Vigna angularis]|uniref:Uncharacterized protein n=1 Tax=Phaseolus angularis TaxID=3914 RepID=A0A0L9UF19_PHAAN|nr:hypothetical protein LR48_Vigan04g135500 [Vigna angularis]